MGHLEIVSCLSSLGLADGSWAAVGHRAAGIK